MQCDLEDMKVVQTCQKVFSMKILQEQLQELALNIPFRFQHTRNSFGYSLHIPNELYSSIAQFSILYQITVLPSNPTLYLIC